MSWTAQTNTALSALRSTIGNILEIDEIELDVQWHVEGTVPRFLSDAEDYPILVYEVGQTTEAPGAGPVRMSVQSLDVQIHLIVPFSALTDIPNMEPYRALRELGERMHEKLKDAGHNLGEDYLHDCILRSWGPNTTINRQVYADNLAVYTIQAEIEYLEAE